MKPFAIFKKGSWKDSQGRPFEADDAKLDAILAANQGKAAPIVIGHPKLSSPKWGTASAFSRVGDLLMATPDYLAPEFAEWVKKKLWDKISISLNEDMTIRHIGFLGATPPAVAGMPDVEFAGEEKALVFEFADWGTTSRINDIGALFGRLRDFIVEKFDLATADNVLSSYDIDRLKAMQPDPDESMPMQTGFSKPEGGDDMKTVAELEAELATEKAKTAEFSKASEKVAALETELKTEKQKNQVAEFSAFLGSDEMKKRVSPAMLPEMKDFMAIFAGVRTFEFSAADGKKEAKAPLEAFKEFSKKYLPEILTAEELATGKKAATGGGVKEKREAAEAEFGKSHPEVKNYSELVLAVSKEQPELYADR